MTASARVLVTGATGFIASRIVEQLLAAGSHVRGTVRNLRKPGDIQVLQQLPGAFERLELVEADLLREGLIRCGGGRLRGGRPRGESLCAQRP